MAVAGPRAPQPPLLHRLTAAKHLESAQYQLDSPATPVSASTMNGCPVTRADNIVNQRGGDEASLFRMCQKLRRKMVRVPGLEPWLDEMEAEEQEEDGDTDPVTSMWNMLRRGQPLLTIFNSTNPDNRVEVKTTKLTADNPKFGKQATFDFLAACIKQLHFQSADCFIITDLYGTDTGGFFKVLRLIFKVLDIAEERGLLYSLADDEDADNADGSSKPRTHAENVIHEIVTTERDYVQHLQTLQEFQVLLQHSNIMPGDTLHSIFMNLNQLLDFQRRFLIRVEQQNSLDPDLQNWGQLFHMYKEPFRVYEPFIANQSRCNETVTREWDVIRSAPLPPAFQGMVETQSILLGFLLKPFQRLVKYPMLLEQLIKKGDYDDERINDLRLGVEATNSILTSANEAVAKEARVAAAHDLQVSVDDWKGHKLEEFGELLIFGGQTVLKGDGSREVEREYKVYLFEKILLCCKDVNPNKAKNRLPGSKSAQKGKQRLQLKGRIWMNTITDILHYSKSNSYYLNIYWRSEPAIENFIIRYMNKDTRDKWKGLIEQQRRARNEVQNISPHSSMVAPRQPSQGILYSNINEQYSGTTLASQPYDDEDDDDEVRYTPTTNSISSTSGLTSSRNASNNSLRSRSATGSSAGRMLPQRFQPPNGSGQLHLYTSLPTVPQSASTPDNASNGSSYFPFSPANESPQSSLRGTSQHSQLSNFQFHRSSNNSWMADQTKSRSQDEIASQNMGRTHRGPSLPVVPSTTAYAQQQIPMRSRSASASASNPYPGLRTPGGGEDEPMPPLPLPVAQMRVGSGGGSVNRSLSNSPTDTYRNARNQQPQPPPLSRATKTFPNAYGELHPAMQNGSGSRMPSSMPTSYEGGGGGGYGAVQPPAQLRVKVCFEPRPSHCTIVVASSVSFRMLIERIDAKMERISSASIAKGTARLKYSDSDGDLITIGNDEDVKAAIDEWTETNEAALRHQQVPDFELWWIETSSRMP